MLSTLEEASWPDKDCLLSVRKGKIEEVGRAKVKSAIHKHPIQGSVRISKKGVDADEIEYWAHQGEEKALHQYCSAHYPVWKRDKPDKKDMFNIGAFGENIATEKLHEDNVCIGDTYTIGDEVVVQITEPRTPCYKLNARFEWPQAARRVTKTGRIGWYLRVLQTGSIKEGDEMVLTKRPNPRWSITNTMSVLFGKEVDESLVAEMVKLEGLGGPMKSMAQQRLDQGGSVDSLARTKGASFDWNPYEVEDVRMITPRVRQFTLTYKGPENRLAPETNMGMHAYIRLKFGPDKSLERSYSVVSGDIDKLVLGVALDDNSSGGSLFLHKQVKQGDEVELVAGDPGPPQKPPEDFDPAKVGRHIFIIGGIGVTAFVREIVEFNRKGWPVEVHYACRSLEEAAYKDKLPDDKTTYYAKDQNKRLDITQVIPGPDASGNIDAIVYACGPNSLMDAVEARCKDDFNYPDYRLELESFGATQTGPLGEPFECFVDDIESEKQATVQVPAEMTLLDTLTKAGFDVPYSCKAGRCGVCVVNIRCGDIQHKGTALLEEDKKTAMLSCVSRGRGKIEIEIE